MQLLLDYENLHRVFSITITITMKKFSDETFPSLGLIPAGRSLGVFLVDPSSCKQ